MTQYPYTLEIGIVSTTPTRDENGDYTEGQMQWQTVGKCRDEAASRGDFTTTTDGQRVSFSWMVYAPPGTPEIAYEKTVRVTDQHGNIRAAGTVKRFYRGQMNCRIWL